ncbi:hypothetical protein V1633_22570 [Plantactinospora sonchi]|uniref:Tight adherence protein B n=1 Tax=Plantactinospora sonchi TaxID=1544735 RepID=A0ABU7RXP9_9ACTN
MTDRWLAAACVAGVAFLVAWSGGRVRARYRTLVAAGRRSAAAVPSGAIAGRGDITSGAATGPTRWRALDGWFAAVAPWRLILVGVVLGGTTGALVAGPVAAVLLAAYTGLAVRAAVRRRSNRRAERARRDQLDGLCALAADLRAGLAPFVLPPPTTAQSRLNSRSESARPATGLADPAWPATRLTELARSAVRLAEQTGAPLADLVERIEADARAMDRGLAAAHAQAAGARATGWLLAVLPLGGIALGYGIGVDPLRILLHTPVGAACAVAAVVLQLAGLLWTDRLSNSTRATP